MKLSEYQEKTRSTRIYPEDMKIVYPCLGLSGEVGEVCDKIKKIYRDKNGCFSENDIYEIAKEMGDILWYLSALADDLNIDLNDVAKINIEKTTNRKEHGKISGNGDNR